MSQNSWDDMAPYDHEELVKLEQDYSLIPTLPSEDKQAVIDFVRCRLGPSDAQYSEVAPCAGSDELSAFDAALNSKRPFWALISLAYGIPSDGKSNSPSCRQTAAQSGIRSPAAGRAGLVSTRSRSRSRSDR